MVKRILYIEDNYYNILLVKKILEKEGFSFYEAKDGISGIDLAKKIMPDIILMDINLPDLSGLEVTTKIRSIPEMENVKIIALTADVSEGSKERSITAGCDGFISKPIDKNFVDQLKKYLSGQKDQIQDKEKQVQYLKEYSVSLVEKLENKIKELTKSNEEIEKAYKAIQNVNKKLLFLNKMEENFISISSHELRTPIVVIKGFIDLAIDNSFGELSPKLSEILQICQSNIDKLIHIVDDITDFSKLKNSTTTITINEINIGEFINTVKREFANIFELRKISFSTGINCQSQTMFAEQELLLQVLQNYLSNAIRNTPDGGHIELGITEKNDSFIYYIKDNGVGIEEKYLDKIFDKFFVIRDASHHFSGSFEYLSGGKGLGLAIVKNISKLHHGKAWAESDGLGKGSCFYISIPKNFEKKLRSQTLISNEKKYIYLIDYSENVNLFMTSLFEALNYTIDDFMDKLDSLESPLMVLIDIASKPLEKSLTLIKTLKNDPKFSDVPVIVLDEVDNPITKSEIFLIGAEGYITKPLDKNSVNRILNALI